MPSVLIGQYALRHQSPPKPTVITIPFCTLGVAVATFFGVLTMVNGRSFADDGNQLPGTEKKTIEFPDTVENIAWSNNNKYIAATNIIGNIVYIYDLEKNHLRWSVNKSGLSHEGIVFSPDDRYVITGPTNKGGGQRFQATVGLVSVETGSERNLLETIPSDDTNHATRISLSSDKKWLVALIGHKGRIRIYDTSTWKETQKLGPIVDEKGSVSDGYIELDSIRDAFYFGSSKGLISTWQLSSNKKLAIFPVYDVKLTAMIINKITGSLITGASAIVEGRLESNSFRDGLQDDALTGVREWNPLTGEQLHTFVGPGAGVNSLSLAADGRYLAATKGGVLLPGYLLTWDATTGQTLTVRGFGKGHHVEAAAFSRDGRMLAYALDNTVHILDLNPELFR